MAKFSSIPLRLKQGILKKNKFFLRWRVDYCFEEKGEGRPLLFLHGYLSNKESFYFQTQSLCQNFKTVAIDLAGFGKTPEPTYPYSLDDYVEFTLKAIDERCGGKTDIIAHSFGGRIAIKLACQYPEKVGKMLLVGCAGMKPRRGVRYHAKRLTYKTLKKISPSLAEKKIGLFASRDYLNLSPLMRESFKKIVNENLEECAERITAPCLIVFGENDRETPLYMARKLNAKIKDSELIVLKNCSHFCFVERSIEFNEIAKEFFI